MNHIMNNTCVQFCTEVYFTLHNFYFPKLCLQEEQQIRFIQCKYQRQHLSLYLLPTLLASPIKGLTVILRQMTSSTSKSANFRLSVHSQYMMHQNLKIHARYGVLYLLYRDLRRNEIRRFNSDAFRDLRELREL